MSVLNARGSAAAMVAVVLLIGTARPAASYEMSRTLSNTTYLNDFAYCQPGHISTNGGYGAEITAGIVRGAAGQFDSILIGFEDNPYIGVYQSGVVAWQFRDDLGTFRLYTYTIDSSPSNILHSVNLATQLSDSHYVDAWYDGSQAITGMHVAYAQADLQITRLSTNYGGSTFDNGMQCTGMQYLQQGAGSYTGWPSDESQLSSINDVPSGSRWNSTYSYPTYPVLTFYNQ